MAGRNCAKCCVFSIVLWLRRLAKSAPKSEVARRTGCPRCRQNLHHAVWREKDLETKIIARFGALFEVGLWCEGGLEAKASKTPGAQDVFLEVQFKLRFAWQAQVF